jgi:hypothetical protein
MALAVGYGYNVKFNFKANMGECLRGNDVFIRKKTMKRITRK